jgi:putative transposase
MRNPTLQLTHPETTRERLIAYSRKVPGAYIGIKIAAFLLFLEGQRPGWIIQVLGLTRQSLNQWIHKVNREGLSALPDKPRSGRPTKLVPKVATQLQQDLEKPPKEFGFAGSHWDGPTLVVHLRRSYGISLKVRQVQNWMHQLGFVMLRAGYSYLQAQGKEARKFYKTLKKTSRLGTPRDRNL